MINLIYNEQLKLLRKKRLYVIMVMIFILVSLFTYAQYKQTNELIEKMGHVNWRVQLQQKIVDTQNRLNSTNIPNDFKQTLKIQVSQQQYYLDHNIDPAAPGAPTFMRIFIENAISLLLPLLVLVIASDLVSSEYSNGTIKLLLTRPVKRWKILMSKYFALLLSISLILFCMALFSYLISGLIFGYNGWSLPMITGFKADGNTLNTTGAYTIPLWKYVVIEYGLAWFVGVVVGALTLLLSVLIRSTAAVMGIMLASLIAGAILVNMVSSWHSAKYLFMLNLQLTHYIHGTNPPITGMTLGFSLIVLLIWLVISIIFSFAIFTKQDVY
ncbi:ABC transporter permease subunit [Terrilactibacillus sp. BCM23-1]|uniref:ABC transporter permease subunit n=1 Tax=Terrilactibacillus tamarindi TaxID=2599694 RepID=A0A6N8CSI8_9BACI|nr:ABC transporter permease [Terrilactibacillus tamarindi]MTT32660.1 ABC transporter permease subunit [Terrilactibacillus tamarindi]